MIIVMDARPAVANAFVALFEREGVPATAIAPDAFAEWVGAADAADLAGVELFLGRCDVAAARARSSAPIIAIAAEGGLDATLDLFAEGHDDVVRAPVHAREIMARAAAIRCRRRAEADPTLRFGLLAVHADGRDPAVAGEALPLPRRERRVLEVLAGARGRFVTKAQLFSAVYGVFATEIEESVVESHVSKLRRKLRAALGQDPIVSRRFQGYAMAAVNQPATDQSPASQAA